MHAPDGFLSVGTAVATGAISAATLSAALGRSSSRLADRELPLAGVSAAFIFAAQMFNFPVAAGTTGHLIGGALAAILLGPRLGLLVTTVVVVVQALVFADGGLTALGYNVLNMAIVTTLGGWVIFSALRRFLSPDASGVVVASGIAGGLSVVLASMAFSLEWLFGASAPVAFDTVFGAVVGVHLLIGIGEGVLTGLAVGAVLSARPDLVYGARGLRPAEALAERRLGVRGFVLAGGSISIVLAAVVSQFAGSAPDGLEWAANRVGFSGSAEDHALGMSPFADYATIGLDSPGLSLAVAGVTGVVIVGVITSGLVSMLREKTEVAADIDLTGAILAKR